MMYFGLFIAGTFFGVVILSIFRSGSIADEMALIDEIDRLKRALALHTHLQQQRQGSIVPHVARVASVPRGDA